MKVIFNLFPCSSMAERTAVNRLIKVRIFAREPKARISADRMLVFETKGHWFESSRAHQAGLAQRLEQLFCKQ